jgi:hypothetical protein
MRVERRLARGLLIVRSAVLVLVFTAAGRTAERTAAALVEREGARNSNALLWKAPNDAESRNLFYGCGGEQDQPRGVFRFDSEDLHGTTAKITAHDHDGVKWKLKLGSEARPETVASRLVWAAGFYADEDYFVPELRVENLPARLRRGQKFVRDGALHNVRLKRNLNTQHKIGSWHWADSPFTGTREWNGLRTMMALINNWDVTDENTAIYQTTTGELSYEVSDLGSSFGAGHLTWPLNRSRDNLHCYRESKFITRITREFVEFNTPRRDSLFFLVTPREFLQKLRLRWLAKNVPRSDARWMGELLARLSADQIRESFRAAGYSPQEIEGFARTVQERIRQLQQL